MFALTFKYKTILSIEKPYFGSFQGYCTNQPMRRRSRWPKVAEDAHVL